MKTDVFKLTGDRAELERMLDESEKAAKYSDLDKKQTIRLRLLAEELIGMVPELVEYVTGDFWIESEGKAFELHISATLDDMFSADRDKLMSLSKSGKNAAAKGIMGKIRSAFETMLFEYASLPPEIYNDYYTMGMMPEPYYYSSLWSLEQYRQAAEQNEDAWDELEKSIVANLADDVVVGIKGKNVDIIVKKNFA
ncbi:MAG: hypothetical protein IKS17_01405 [Firmicutes bacterium]|nr:hypothetical protein [Bacillota bacterium]